MTIMQKTVEDGGLDVPTMMLFVRHIMAKVKADEAKKEQAAIRDQLVETLMAVEPDSDGHRTYELDKPVAGYGSVQYQRRASVVPVEDIVERMDALGLSDCTTTVRVVDEEELMKAVYNGRISNAQMDSLYQTKETFAVVVKRG